MLRASRSSTVADRPPPFPFPAPRSPCGLATERLKRDPFPIRLMMPSRLSMTGLAHGAILSPSVPGRNPTPRPASAFSRQTSLFETRQRRYRSNADSNAPPPCRCCSRAVRSTGSPATRTGRCRRPVPTPPAAGPRAAQTTVRPALRARRYGCVPRRPCRARCDSCRELARRMITSSAQPGEKTGRARHPATENMQRIYTPFTRPGATLLARAGRSVGQQPHPRQRRASWRQRRRRA